MIGKSTGYLPLILTEYSILKEDKAFQMLELPSQGRCFSGTENFRKVDNVFGLAQPTHEGITNIVEYYQRKIVWMNLREEPVIYINSVPYVLRDKAAAFLNIRSFVGISASRLEEMEERLKKDVLELSHSNRGFIEVHVEKQGNTLWKSTAYVKKVETVREIFLLFKDRIAYHRVPVSRKLYNKEHFLAVLDGIFRETQRKGEKVLFGFNCGHGSERTSYAIAAYLVSLGAWVQRENREAAEVTAKEASESEKMRLRKRDAEMSPDFSEFSRVVSVLEEVIGKEKISSWLIKMGNITPVLEKALRGEYVLVERLVHAFDGAKAKQMVDEVLRELKPFSFLEILLEHVLKAQSGTDSKRSLKKACILMERYVSLILYGVYKERANSEEMSFAEWIGKNPGAKGYISEIATETPLLGLFAPADIIDLSQPETARRWTMVIGAKTILKADVPVAKPALEEINGMYTAHQIQKVEKSPMKNSTTGAGVVKMLDRMQVSMKKEKAGESGDTRPRLSRAEKNSSDTIWVNLRAEPVVYIGNVPHSERERTAPFRNIRSVSGITKELIAAQEKTLSQRVRNEGLRKNGRVVLFDTTDKGELVTKRVKSHKEISTCDGFLLENLAISEYHRVPVPSKAPFDPNMVDALLEIILTRGKASIVFQSSNFRRAERARALGVVVELAHEEQSSAEGKTRAKAAAGRPLIKQIEALLRILPNGTASESIVREAYVKTNQEDIYAALEKREEESGDGESLQVLDHFTMICVASYILSRSDEERISFRQWMNRRQDVKNMYRELRESPLGSKSALGLVDRAWGSVLTPHTILKDDFFPALRMDSKDLVRIKGCSNFRTVKFEGTEAVGVAQPAQWGVVSLAEYFSEDPTPIHWFCLRQEPVVYLNSIPYVLRTIDSVYENVITEGITRVWVEDIEERMKADCKEENSRRVLKVHEEVMEQDGPKLVEKNMDVQENEIQSLKEIFAHKRIVYYRIPVSDEQTPLPETYDELYRAIVAIPSPRRVIFSCQMGRGRTTTGMIIAGLISFAENLKKMKISERKNLLEEKRYEVVYNDEYLIISKLLQVLPAGRESKNIVDALAKECSQIQNIYEAIGKKNSTGYLVRYFYLVCFGAFLIETIDKPVTFTEYLSERTEIDAIANEKEYHLLN